MKKVYITKYALTDGILEKEVETTFSPTMVVTSDRIRQSFHKPFWHDTKEEAMLHAESLRQRKIASVKKLLAKLEKMDFSK